MNARVNLNGSEVYFEACVSLMDNDIVAQLNDDIVPCTEQEYLDAYIKAHFEKFSEDFTI